DDHAVLRDGLTELINQSKDLVVCGEAASGEQAMDLIPGAAPDLVVVDLSLPGMNGLELVTALKAKHPSIRLLVLSIHDEALYGERAIRAGARGYIMKHQVAREVQAAIHTVLAGELYLSPDLSKKVLEAALQPEGARTGFSIDRLSDREMEVFKLIGK